HSATRRTSVRRDSLIGLPMSRVSSRASSSAWLRTRSASFSNVRLRSFGAACDHTPDSNAARAPATARSTSGAEQAATFAGTPPSIGLTHSNVSPVADSRYSPSMNARSGMSISAASALQSSRVAVDAIASLLLPGLGACDVRGRVDVLAGDGTVVDGHHVDAVPLDAATVSGRRSGGPLAHADVQGHVQPAAREPQGGPTPEDAGDGAEGGVPPRPRFPPRRVVLEDDVFGVYGCECADVLVVPGSVVTRDQIAGVARHVRRLAFHGDQRPRRGGARAARRRPAPSRSRRSPSRL